MRRSDEWFHRQANLTRIVYLPAKREKEKIKSDFQSTTPVPKNESWIWYRQKKRHKNKTQLHWTRNNAKIESILGGGLQKKSFEGKTFSPMHHFFYWTRGKFPSATSKLELQSRARSKCGISSSSFEVFFSRDIFQLFRVVTICFSRSRNYLLLWRDFFFWHVSSGAIYLYLCVEQLLGLTLSERLLSRV